VEFTISPKKAGFKHQTAFWVLIMVNNSSLLHNCQASAYLRLIKKLDQPLERPGQSGGTSFGVMYG